MLNTYHEPITNKSCALLNTLHIYGYQLKKLFSMTPVHTRLIIFLNLAQCCPRFICIQMHHTFAYRLCTIFLTFKHDFYLRQKLGMKYNWINHAHGNFRVPYWTGVKHIRKGRMICITLTYDICKSVPCVRRISRSLHVKVN